MLNVSTGRGFQQFSIGGLLEGFDMLELALCPDEMASDGRSYLELLRDTGMSATMRECLLRLRSLVRPPTTIHLFCDEHSINRSALLWACQGMGICGTWDRDPYHRAWNDLKQAIYGAGMSSVWTSALVMLNAVHGPWQSSTWFTDMVEAMWQMTEEMGPDDRLLAEFWDGIVEDSQQSRTPGAVVITNDEAGKRAFLAGLSSLRPLWRKGVKVSTSRWFSFSQKMGQMDHCWCSMCMAMVCLMIKQGWVESWQELLEGKGETIGAKKKVIAAASAAASSVPDPPPQPQPASGSDGPARPPMVDSKPAGHNDVVQQTRQRLQALRARCKNTLDWCGRLMLDTDLRSYVRMLHEGTKPVHEAYVQETRVVREVHSRQAHFIDRSTCGWSSTLVATLDVLSNANTLERCGIACEELSLRRLQANPDEASFHAMMQHERCLHLTRFVTSLVSVRATSLLQHAETFPQTLLGLLAADLATDERLVGERLQHCYRAVQAVSLAGASSNPEVRQMYQESPLHLPFVQICIGLLSSVGYSRVPTVLAQMLICYARSIGQTRIIEEGNQKIRDTEIRKSAGKAMQCLSIWDAEAGSAVIEEYGMSNLQYLSAAGSPPTDDAWTRVFDVNKYQSYLAEVDAETAGHLNRASELEWQPKLKEITGQRYNHLHGTNPRGDAERMCDQAFLMHLQRTSRWDLAERHWMAGLLPTQELVRPPGLHNPPVYFVLWRGKRGCLAWTMEASSGVYEFSRGPTPWRWLHNLAFEDWVVIPSRYTSPLENMRLHGIRKLQRAQSGEPQPLLEWFAQNAYPECSESTLKMLHAWHGITVPGGLTTNELSEREQLKFNLMVRLVPAMSASDALHSLLAANHRELPPDPFMMTLDTEMLNDCILGGEHQQLQTDLADITAKSSVRDATASRVRAKLSSYKWGGGQMSEGPSKLKPLPEYSMSVSNMDAMKEYIREHGPRGTQVCGDFSNQRFQLGYTGVNFVRKSVSWNKRGVQKCLSSSVAWLWEQHGKHTGEPSPYAFQ
eukprot:6489290-Amphidinium_carterae.1